MTAAPRGTRIGHGWGTPPRGHGWAHWRQRGLLHVEQSRPGSPLWVRLTEQELARLDGTLARQGAGQWTSREAERAWGLSRAAFWERVRRGEIIGYRMRIDRRWQWRLSRPGGELAGSPQLAVSRHQSCYR